MNNGTPSSGITTATRSHRRIIFVVVALAMVSFSATLLSMDFAMTPQGSDLTVVLLKRDETTDPPAVTESPAPAVTEPPVLTEPPAVTESPAPAVTEPPAVTESKAPPAVDDWFPSVTMFPKDAKIHSEQFIARSSAFDASVSRTKGLVICLHNGNLPMGLSLIKEVRCLGNAELIQVYYCLPSELTPENQQRILNEDNRLELIDACSDLIEAKVFSLDDARKFQSWWLKPLALHHTTLEHVIILDADDILLLDPELVRRTPGYKTHGTMFFYDRVLDPGSMLDWHIHERNDIQILRLIIEGFNYGAFGLTGPKPSQQLLNSAAYQGKTAHEMDSSMVAVDKTRAGKAMDVLWWIITKLRFAHYEFSYGDKESFWLAFELAQVPYAFSPWGVSVVSSWPNNDMEKHPDTLCGSIAHYVPVNDATPPELFYVNGDAMLDPLTQGVDNKDIRRNIMYNANATHVSPRMPRAPRQPSKVEYPGECLVGFGSTPLPSHFQKYLLRRRLHYAAVSVGLAEPLAQCEFL